MVHRIPDQIFGCYLLNQNFNLLQKSNEYNLDNSIFNVPINLTWILIGVVLLTAVLVWYATRNELLHFLEAVGGNLFGSRTTFQQTKPFLFL